MSPVSPPMEKRNTKVRAKSIGGLTSMDPCKGLLSS